MKNKKKGRQPNANSFKKKRSCWMVENHSTWIFIKMEKEIMSF